MIKSAEEWIARGTHRGAQDIIELHQRIDALTKLVLLLATRQEDLSEETLIEIQAWIDTIT